MKRYDMCWSKLDSLLKERKYNTTAISVIMGYNDRWYANAKGNKHKLDTEQVSRLALILNCKAEDIIMPEPLQEEKKENDSGLETVLDEIQAIKEKINTGYEILMFLFNKAQQEQNDNDVDELEIATGTLKKLLENRQAIKRDTYMDEAIKAGVKNIKVADAAIAKLGLYKKTTGFGENKAVWIYKPVV